MTPSLLEHIACSNTEITVGLRRGISQRVKTAVQRIVPNTLLRQAAARNCKYFYNFVIPLSSNVRSKIHQSNCCNSESICILNDTQVIINPSIHPLSVQFILHKVILHRAPGADPWGLKLGETLAMVPITHTNTHIHNFRVTQVHSLTVP